MHDDASRLEAMSCGGAQPLEVDEALTEILLEAGAVIQGFKSSRHSLESTYCHKFAYGDRPG